MLTVNFFTDRTISSSHLKYEASRVVSEDPTCSTYNLCGYYPPDHCTLWECVRRLVVGGDKLMGVASPP
jgi:hypothetical protein